MLPHCAEEPTRLTAGPLTVATTGAYVAPGAGRSLCVLDGALYETGDLAARAGLDPSLPVLELLALAYPRLGAQVLEPLRGDFLLVLYDVTRDEGIAARDHMGGRPAYWHRGSGGTIFAGDPKLLLSYLPGRPGPDPVALAHWVGVSGLPEDRTLFDGVRRIEAGCLLRLSRGSVTPGRYWNPPYRAPATKSRDEAVAGLRARLVTAVQRRAAEPSVGILLSGGLDSSTVAAFAARGPGAPPLAGAWSAVFPDHPSVDESALVSAITSRLGLSSTRAVVRGGSVLYGSLDYLERFALPPVSPNLFFWMPLLRHARAAGASSLLDGEGGDELFGLSPMLLADRLRRARILSMRRLVDRVPGADGNPSRDSVRAFIRRFALAGAAPPWLHTAVRRARGYEAHTSHLLAPTARRALFETLGDLTWKQLPGPRWWAFLVQAVTRGMGPALLYEHVALRSRLAGLDSRHPLVDVDVVEEVLSLPPEAAYDPRLSRPLLRATTEGLLPDQVRFRPSKSTFDAVFHAAFAGQDLPVLRGLLGDTGALVGEYVDLHRVKDELLDPGAPTAPRQRMEWAIALWRIATAELWLRSQEDPDAPREVLESFEIASPDVQIIDA